MATWLLVVIALLTFLHDLGIIKGTEPRAAMTDEQIRQVAQAATIGAAQNLPNDVPAKTDKRERPAPGDPCWCGSGSRYKHCHGKR